jgi:hypothetical protein
MLCPMEPCKHPPCTGQRTAVGRVIMDEDDGSTTVVRAFLWVCPMCGTQWQSKEIARNVSTPDSRGQHVAPS